MYEKIVLIVLTLLAVARPEKISLTRTKAKDADFSDSRQVIVCQLMKNAGFTKISTVKSLT